MRRLSAAFGRLRAGASHLRSRWRGLLARYPLDPYGKSRRHQGILLAFTLFALVCAAICLGFVSLVFATLYVHPSRYYSYFDYPALLALNILPLVLAVLLLWLLTNRAWLSFLLTAAPVMILTFINYFKAALRDDPLVFEDIAYAGEAAGVVGNYRLVWPQYSLLALLLCIGGVVALFLFARGRFGWRKRRWLIHTGGALAVLLAMLGVFHFLYADDDLYNSFDNHAWFNEWRPAEEYASHGFVYPFLHSVSEVLYTKPEGYSEQEAEQLLSQYEDADIPEEQKVNVICVMLESFSDLSDCAELNWTEDPYAILHELEEQCISGTMISDTLGGGTCNAERSFLTGSLYPQPSYRHNTWSYVQYFREQDYYTEGGHPGYDWFYNRQVVNANLGFDRYFFQENYYGERTSAEHANDEVFFACLLEQYEQALTSGRTPYFNFSVSYQGHSPYSDSELTWGTEYLSPEGVSDETYYIVNNYLGGVADTQAQMQAFLDALSQRAEPVVVLFFGDHKPTLGTGNSCYAELGINLARDSEQGFENYYGTQYLIYANDAAKAALGQDFTGEGETVGPYFLMNELFAACGWEGPGFLQLSRQLCDTAQTVHASHVFLVDGELAQTPADGGAVLEKFRFVQYYLRQKAYQNP